MIPNIESFYERIANSIADKLASGWQKASVTAIFFPDSVSWEPEFQTAKGDLRSFDISTELAIAFLELREQFEEAGQPLWGQATFVLYSSGRFDMKWGYENCDENGDTIFDEEEWHRRHEERMKRLG